MPSYYLNDGVAKVDYFLVESEESDIELTGSVDLIKRDYNLAANVQPSIADTIPIATYFAGGGLGGTWEFGLQTKYFLVVQGDWRTIRQCS